MDTSPPSMLVDRRSKQTEGELGLSCYARDNHEFHRRQKSRTCCRTSSMFSTRNEPRRWTAGMLSVVHSPSPWRSTLGEHDTVRHTGACCRSKYSLSRVSNEIQSGSFSLKKFDDQRVPTSSTRIIQRPLPYSIQTFSRIEPQLKYLPRSPKKEGRRSKTTPVDLGLACVDERGNRSGVKFAI